MKDKFLVYKHLNNNIVEQLKKIEPLFEAHFINANSEIIDILKFISQTSGKKIRPLMVLLSAEIAGGFSESSLIYAMLIEVLHAASLVHDDIIDLADTRRGHKSVNQKYGNKLAVLAGDYLLSRSLAIIAKRNEPELFQVYARASEDLCLGEILEQRNKNESTGIESKYIDIIDKKTASLFVASCELGVLTAKGKKDVLDKMSEFGHYFGLVFQLKDDLLDYIGDSEETGKKTGTDLSQNIMTYPIIAIQDKLTNNEGKKLKQLIADKNFNDIVAFIQKYGGFKITENKIVEYSQKCENILYNFEESKAQKALLKLVEFNRTRKK